MSNAILDVKKITEPTAPHVAIECVRGAQSGREFYTAMIPLRVLGRLLSDGTEDLELPAEMRQQRKTNPSRAKKIARYMHDNAGQYVLPALTISIESESRFEPTPTSHYSGTLYVAADDVRILVNDGLHRRAGIVEALRKLNHSERRKMSAAAIKAHEARVEQLKDESVSVTIYFAAGLKRAQQIFVDINKNASKPNTALAMTFDHRDRFNVLAREIAAEVFPGRVEFERAVAGEGKLFSINALVSAVKTVAEAWYTGEPDAAELVAFFRHLENSMSKEWKRGRPLVESLGCVEPPPARMSTQNIALEAIAIALASQENWKTLAKRLTGLDWSRDAAQWVDCFVVVDGRIAKNKRSTAAMGASILRSIRTVPKVKARRAGTVSRNSTKK